MIGHFHCAYLWEMVKDVGINMWTGAIYLTNAQAGAGARLSGQGLEPDLFNSTWCADLGQSQRKCRLLSKTAFI